MDINFYKKQTVLNDILDNTNTIVINNSQLFSFIDKVKSNKSEYLVSSVGDTNANYKNTTSDLSKLYISQYGINPTKLSITNDQIIENIKRYNNYKNGRQSAEYYDYDKVSQINSLLVDITYNSLYFIEYNKINLMSYTINQINGFNYDNHMLYFNIDNEYICSLNNTLYYNFNKIKDASQKNKGINLINPNFFNVKNLENNYYEGNHAILGLNKNFKYDLFVSLNKLKNIYYDCENIYNTLSYYINIDEYNNDYITNDNYINTNYIDSTYYCIDPNNYISYAYISSVSFENTKLYYTDKSLGINLLEIDNEEVLYINDLDNIELKIGYLYNIKNNYEHAYINSYNMDFFRNNNTSLIVNENNINTKISYNYVYKYYVENIKSNYIGSYISENQSQNIIKQIDKQNIIKYPVNTSYHINISSGIDKTIFNNSGLNVIYQGSPYLLLDEKIKKIEKTVDEHNIISYYSYIENQTFVIPQKHELSIRSINNKVFNHSYTNISCLNESFNTSENSYFLLSTKNLFYTDDLIISDCNRIYYGSRGNITIKSPSLIRIYKFGKPDIQTEGCVCVKCKIKINDYLFNELYSRNIITKNPNLHYYYIAPLYIDNNEIYNENNLNKEYIPILNNYPTKYLNEKFFSSKIYDDNYPIKEEIDTCISNINDLSILGYDKLYLYEIQKDGEIYKLIFYSIFPDINLRYNISQQYVNNSSNLLLNVYNDFFIEPKLYGNYKFNELKDKNTLYEYLYTYLNNFICF